jgi:glyoxylase-like metal-dependent hydrolase (beta-lactamase superfamily II)
VLVERSMNEDFLSNTYLVAREEGGPAFFVDAGGPVAPLIDAAKRHRLEPTHVLLTHHHHDHVSQAALLTKRWPKLQVLINPLERELLQGVATGTIEAGQSLEIGQLRVRPLHTPGHTLGMLSFLVQGRGGSDQVLGSPDAPGATGGAGASRHPEPALAVFTGDTLFKGSVGGVRAPGHTTYIDLKDSIMGTLMELPASTVIYPGHKEPTTVRREWESNPFVRLWRGVDREGSTACTALGQPATLILSCPDYDGGTKAWVRWADGRDDIVPGSQVQPA